KPPLSDDYPESWPLIPSAGDLFSDSYSSVVASLASGAGDSHARALQEVEDVAASEKLVADLLSEYSSQTSREAGTSRGNKASPSSSSTSKESRASSENVVTGLSHDGAGPTATSTASS
ncbi:unnamed protein product, partial [Amoebophrya sp. A25]